MRRLCTAKLAKMHCPELYFTAHTASQGQAAVLDVGPGSVLHTRLIMDGLQACTSRVVIYFSGNALAKHKQLLCTLPSGHAALTSLRCLIWQRSCTCVCCLMLHVQSNSHICVVSVCCITGGAHSARGGPGEAAAGRELLPAAARPAAAPPRVRLPVTTPAAPTSCLDGNVGAAARHLPHRSQRGSLQAAAAAAGGTRATVGACCIVVREYAVDNDSLHRAAPPLFGYSITAAPAAHRPYIVNLKVLHFAITCSRSQTAACSAHAFKR